MALTALLASPAGAVGNLNFEAVLGTMLLGTAMKDAAHPLPGGGCKDNFGNRQGPNVSCDVEKWMKEKGINPGETQ